MSRGRRLVWTLPAWGGLLAFAWFSWQAYASQRDPEHYRGHWWVGPPAESLNAAAEGRLSDGVSALGDPVRPIGERLSRYEQELTAAESLLTRSLRLRPTQARSLARLAATRWELAHTRGESAAAAPAALAAIETASRLASDDPRVQFDLGELLLKMGRTDAAGRAFARALELDPAQSAGVVDELVRERFGGDEILELLPAGGADLLVAVAPVFHAEGRAATYRDLLEREMDPESAACLAAFGAASLASGRTEDLIEHLNALGVRSTDAAEAERLQQLALAYLDQGRSAQALEAAHRARERVPRSGDGAERLGDVAQVAGDHPAARAAYGDALALWARAPDKPARRARLYRKIGQSHEAEGRNDLAFAAFRMALRLNQEEHYALRRVAEIEAAGGAGSRSGGKGG